MLVSVLRFLRSFAIFAKIVEITKIATLLEDLPSLAFQCSAIFAIFRNFWKIVKIAKIATLLGDLLSLAFQCSAIFAFCRNFRKNR